MFNSFRNSDLAYYLYTAFVIVLGIGSLIFFYFMVTGFNIGVYEPNTLIGNVYVGGLSESEAEEKVRNSIDEWYENDNVVYELAYQGYYYEIDRNLFTFDVSGSFENVTNGTRNQLIVELSPQALSNIDFELHSELFMSGMQGIFDFDRVMDAVIEDASRLQQFSRHQLNHYLIDEAQLTQTINEITIPLHNNGDVDALLAKIETTYPDMRVPIEPHSIFSVFDMFPETLSSTELNTIGSGLLDLIIPTRMEIYERHYNPQISDVSNSPYLGRNVRVNRHPSLNYDFKFENTSYLNYEIEFYRTGTGLLGMRLHGAQSLDRVEIEVEELFLPYREAPEGSTILSEGETGKVIFVYREIFDIEDNLKSRTLIVFEYYEPLDPIYE